GLSAANILAKDNNEVFSPISDFNPATKKYVDDAAATKANKTIPGEAGAIAALDANGNLIDTGVLTTDFLSSSTSATQIPFTPNGNTAATNVQAAIVEVRNDLDSAKANKVNTATDGHMAVLTASGDLRDSGFFPTDFIDKNNSIPFTPVADFHPSTKKYVDDAGVNKADKVVGADVGNLAALNASGNLIDSGYSAADFLASTPNASQVAFTPTTNVTSTNVQSAVDEVAQDLVSGLAGRANKVSGATLGNFAGLNSSGNLTDSNFSPDDYLHKTNTEVYEPTTPFNPATKQYVDDKTSVKADKVVPSAVGNIAVLSASGNLTDSGVTYTNFLTTSSSASAFPFTPNGDIVATNVQNAIVEVRDDTDTKLGAKMSLVAAPTTGNIATLNASGQAIDSGFSPSSFLTSTPPASGVAFTPNGDIAATNVQNAIVEVRNETDAKLTVKMDIVEAPVNGNIAILNGAGQALDSGVRPSNFMSSNANASTITFTPNGDIVATNIQNAVVEVRNDTDTKLGAKMALVSAATAGNLATLNASGQAVDSGLSPSSFLTSSPPATGVAFTPNGDIAANNVQNAIVEVRDETDTKLAAKMNLDVTAVAGNIATLNASGQVVDSGFSPASFLTSSPPATGVAFAPNGDIVATNVQNAIVEVRNDTDVKVSARMLLVENVVNGNLAVLDGTGQAFDSGLRPGDLMSSSANASTISFTPNGDIASTNIQSAVVEVRNETDAKLALLRRQTMAFIFGTNIVFPSATVTLTFNRMASQMLIPAASLSHPGASSITAVMVMIYSTTVNNLTGEAGLMDMTTSSTVAAINGSTMAITATASTTAFNTIVSPEFTLPAGSKVYSPVYRKTVAITGSFTVQSVALILKYNV
ncbi:MAG: hypothetical protein ACRCYO_03540, partial [Bacteroidia bacterium]